MSQRRSGPLFPALPGRIERHFGRQLRDLAIPPMDFVHFGLSVDFDYPVELSVHDDQRRLDEDLKACLARFGAVLLRNAYLPKRDRAGGQRNVFKSLSFHLDRGSTQADHFKLFWRDPFDPEMQAPRSSTTLILANAAAYLQAVKEGAGEHEFKQRYELLAEEDIASLVGDIVFELPWSAPAGTGEMALLDNRTVLHASYYRKKNARGYPIAVRYLY